MHTCSYVLTLLTAISIWIMATAHTSVEEMSPPPTSLSDLPVQDILSVYPHRELVHITHGCNDTDFDILSYNLLAQCYVFKSRYPYTKDFSQKFRHQALMKEMNEIGAGVVVCFQEVTEKYFSSLLQPALTELGYLSVFKLKSGKKAGAAPSKEGLAIFYQKSKTELLEVIELELNAMLGEAWMEMYGPDSDLPPDCYRDTISLAVVLRIHNSVVVIGTTHLPWSKVYWDVQSLYVSLILKRLAEVAHRHGTNAYVLCGDFNRKPQFELYQLVTSGEITQTQRNFMMSSDNKIEVPNVTEPSQCVSTNGTLSKVTLPFYKVFEKYYTIPEPMKSAYATILGDEPKFTFFADSQSCVDYIFYSSALLGVSVLHTPSKDKLCSETALPNSVMSSDHISLKAVFRFA